MLHELVAGLSALAAPKVAGLLVAGVAVGVFFGVLPGLGVALLLSIMLAFVYHLGVTAAIALMLATQAGSYFSASITAILLNTPGAPESMAVTFDGFQMSRRGEAGKALGISATCTCLGGLVGCAALLGLLQVVNYLPLAFHPPEYVALIVLAVVLTGTLGTDSVSKAVLSAAVGLMISFIGDDPVTGTYRYTLGIPALYGGVSIVALALGTFAVPQMVFMYGSGASVANRGGGGLQPGLTRDVLAGVRMALQRWFLLVRSALVGVACGIVPGIGGFTANFLAYGIAQHTSRRGSEFGTGIPEGVVAPESSSLAKEAGSLVPAIGLGLPSGLGMVLFLAALSILGLQPGIGFAQSHPSLPYTMLWTVAIGGVLGTAMGLVAAPGLARVTQVRGPLLFPFIVGLAVVGAYVSDTSMTTVVEMIVFSVIGIAFHRLRYSLAALAVGLVLGGDLETNVFLTHQIFGWNFYNRPLTDILFALVLVALLGQARRLRRQRTGHQGLAAPAGRLERTLPGGGTGYPVLELAVAAIILVLSVIYLIVGLGYGPNERLLPVLVSSVAVVAAAVQTLRGIVRRRQRAHAPAAAQLAGDRVLAPGDAGESAPSPVLADATADVMERTAGSLRTGGGADLVNPPAPGEESLTSPQAGGGSAEPAPDSRPHYRREAVAFAWVLAMVVSAYLLGFLVAIPLAVLLYGLLASGCASRRTRLVFAVTSAIVMAGATYGMFNVLHLSYPGLLNL